MNNTIGIFKMSNMSNEPTLKFASYNETAQASLTFVSESSNLVFETAGNFIFKGGWVFSWTTYLLSGIIAMLIIWNLWLTFKVRKSEKRRTGGGE